MPVARIRRAHAVPGALIVLACALATPASGQGGPPTAVDFKGSANSPISSSVGIPANAAWVWTSGTTPSPADRNQPAGSRARYGDTKTQAMSALQNIEARLTERGLSMKDVVYLRVYVVADKEKGGVPDYQGFFDAYAQFFGTSTNPAKPARSTLGVASLVNADLLIEIEAFAVYPAR